MDERSPKNPPQGSTAGQQAEGLFATIYSFEPGELTVAGEVKAIRTHLKALVKNVGPDVLFADFVMGGAIVRGVVIEQNRQTGQQNWILDDKCVLRYWETRGEQPVNATSSDWLRLAPKIPEALERKLWIHQRRTGNQPQVQS